MELQPLNINQNKNNSLIPLDLNGTISAHDLIISATMRRTIRDAQAADVIVTIATGRMFRSARQIAEDLDIVEFLICYQGAMMAHSVTEEVLYHKTVPLDLTRQIIRETARKGLHLNLYLNDKTYVK